MNVEGDVHTPTVNSKCGKMIVASRETFTGRSWKGGVRDDSEDWACVALLSSPPTHTQDSVPSPSAAPAAEGQPMTHTSWSLGFGEALLHMSHINTDHSCSRDPPAQP